MATGDRSRDPETDTPGGATGDADDEQSTAVAVQYSRIRPSATHADTDGPAAEQRKNPKCA